MTQTLGLPSMDEQTGKAGGATLDGYRRSDGRYGVRNLVAVMAAADNANPLVRRLAAETPGVVCLEASYGRGQLGEDLKLTLRTMAGLATHPNLSQCLVVSFDSESALRIRRRTEDLGRPCQTLSLLQEGGFSACLQRGKEILSEMLAQSTKEQRQTMQYAHLLVGSECGGSDATSGLLSNPTLGWVVDWILDRGGSVVFSEPVECLGCEKLLAERACNSELAQELLRVVDKYRRIALEHGVSLTGINPTADNMAGGLSTIEEKALGAIAKGGSRPIDGLLDYGQKPSGPGLWFMDAPAAAVENLTALAAAGCQVILFSTGSGNPVGHPLAPTIKVCANSLAARRMSEHIDVDISNGLRHNQALEACGNKVRQWLEEVCRGEITAAEKLGYLETNISRVGLSV